MLIVKRVGLAILILISSFGVAQVKISQSGGLPHSSSILDLESGTKGFLPPRMTTLQRNAISSPAEGLLIYNTDVLCVQMFRGTQLGWYTFCDLIPGVNTTQVSSVSGLNAMVSGQVVSDGGQAVTARGVCFSTTPLPTITQSNVVVGSGVGTFTAQLGGLLPSTTYYVRAFATNSVGTGYGTELIFTTTAGTTQAITTSGNWTCPESVSRVQILVVGGGGGGGCDNGGGGGGGGVIYQSSFSVTPGTVYPVSIGNGGAGGSSSTIRGSNGGNTIFSTLTALGGGGGGSLAQAVMSGATGGSGGGGSSQPNISSAGGQGTVGQGNPGGGGNGTHWGGSGGGGASSPGSNGISPNGGNGGSGVTYLGYAVGGGGGGGANNAVPGSGGTGGGGNGAMNSSVSPTAGSTNTGGGGGGGGGYYVAGPGAAGGSGIVVIRY